MREIVVCDNPNQYESGKDIVLCTEDIEICPPQCDELSISGPATVEVGSVYIASGGKGPHSFSVSKGAFSQVGSEITITAMPCEALRAAYAEITVTDSCDPQQQSSLIAKQPGGWRLMGYENLHTGEMTESYPIESMWSADYLACETNTEGSGGYEKLTSGHYAYFSDNEWLVSGYRLIAGQAYWGGAEAINCLISRYDGWAYTGLIYQSIEGAQRDESELLYLNAITDGSGFYMIKEHWEWVCPA